MAVRDMRKVDLPDAMATMRKQEELLQIEISVDTTELSLACDVLRAGGLHHQYKGLA
jgi:hypothetical protein